MGTRLANAGPYVLIAVLAAAMTTVISDPGDWVMDARAAVETLARGDVGSYLRTHALMGPLATAIQAPFVAISPGGGVTAYKWAAFPCLLVCGWVGLYLGGIAARRGAATAVRYGIAIVTLVNPITVAALRTGHPEEVLAAALAVAAVATAAEGKRWWAALLLGMALATKQWTVIAIFPTLMALDRDRLSTGLAAAAVAAALILPSFLASPSVFMGIQTGAATTGDVVTPWSVWYPLADVSAVTVRSGSTTLSAEVHELGGPFGVLSHPLIVVLTAVVPLLVAWVRGGFGLAGREAMALLALLALLRAALDPVDNLYYHAPLFLAALGWTAFAAPRPPLAALVALLAALVMWRWSQNIDNTAAFNYAYIAFAIVAATATTASLLRPGSKGTWTSVRIAPPRKSRNSAVLRTPRNEFP